ncbi:flagellar export protein FliJ [Candidatus Latescibacterota bacterium]
MNRFIFRLQSVLRLREIKEDEKKREFGSAMQKLHHEEKELEHLDTSLQGHEKNMEQQGKGTVTIAQLTNNFNYARSLDGKIDNQTKKVKEEEKVVDGKREELVQSTKQKKILERLKERKREEHDKAVLSEEQDLIDDIASVRSKWNNDISS